MADTHKSVTLVEAFPARYRVRKFDRNGKVIAESWAYTSWRAEEEARSMGGTIEHMSHGNHGN